MIHIISTKDFTYRIVLETMRARPNTLRFRFLSSSQMRSKYPKGDTLIVISGNISTGWREIDTTLRPTLSLKDGRNFRSPVQESLKSK